MARLTTFTVHLTGDEVPESLREEDGKVVEEVMAQIHHELRDNRPLGWGTMVLYTRGTHPDGRPHGRRAAHRYALTPDWASVLFRDTLLSRSLLAVL